jgi:hypothetical protein
VSAGYALVAVKGTVVPEKNYLSKFYIAEKDKKRVDDSGSF